MTREMAFIFYPMTDLDRAPRFYEQTLRLKPEVQTTPVCGFAVVTDPEDNEVLIHRGKS